MMIYYSTAHRLENRESTICCNDEQYKNVSIFDDASQVCVQSLEGNIILYYIVLVYLLASFFFKVSKGIELHI